MPPDPNTNPGQETNDEDLLDLLIESLDSTDLRRTAMLMRAVWLRMDSDREADLERIRRTANHTVTRL